MAADLDTAHPGVPRLRAALAAAASGEVPPAWDVIRDRVVQDDVVEPVPVRPRRWSARPALAAAAAILLVVLAGVAVVAGRDEAPDRFATVGGTIDDVETGWVVPADLPEGWRVTAVTAFRSDEPPCPGPEEEPARGARWTRSDGATVVLTTDRCGLTDTDLGPGGQGVTGPASVDPGELVELGPVTGSLARSQAGSEHRLVWQIGRIPWLLDSTGLTPDELVAVGREVATAGTIDVVPTGFVETDRWTEPPQPHTVVQVDVTTADGLVLAYELAPPGAGHFRDRADARPYRVPGASTAVQSLAATPDPWTARFGVVGAAVDVTLWSSLPTGVAATELTTAQRDGIATAAALLVEALEPATTERWQELLDATEGHTPALDGVATRADLDRVPLATRPQPPSSTEPGPPETIIPSTTAPR